MAREGLTVRRLLIVVISVLGCVLPARAATTPPPQGGSIVLPVDITALTRHEYFALEEAGQPQAGTFGWVLTLERTGGPFTLKTVNDPTHHVFFGIYFYATLDNPSDTTSLSSPTVDGVEHCTSSETQTCNDTIPSGAKYAIVTMNRTVNAADAPAWATPGQFQLTYG